MIGWYSSLPDNGTVDVPVSWTITTTTSSAICPDLLRLEQLGEADNRRGRIVRLFFRLLDVVMPVQP